MNTWTTIVNEYPIFWGISLMPQLVHVASIRFEETLKGLNKKKSKDLTVNDLQHEINIVKQEISELKHNDKSDNNHIKPKMIMLKIDKSNSEHDEHKDGDESSQ